MVDKRKIQIEKEMGGPRSEGPGSLALLSSPLPAMSAFVQCHCTSLLFLSHQHRSQKEDMAGKRKGWV